MQILPITLFWVAFALFSLCLSLVNTLFRASVAGSFFPAPLSPRKTYSQPSNPTAKAHAFAFYPLLNFTHARPRTRTRPTHASYSTPTTNSFSLTPPSVREFPANVGSRPAFRLFDDVVFPAAVFGSTPVSELSFKETTMQWPGRGHAYLSRVH